MTGKRKGKQESNASKNQGQAKITGNLEEKE